MTELKIHNFTPKEDKYGATIIFTHGIAEYSKSYYELATFFQSKGFHVITYDLRGHGQTKGKKGYVNSYKTVLSDLDYLVKEAYKKTKKVFLYGHSMGGIITNLYASSNDVDGVILTASPTKILPALKPIILVPKFLINRLKIKTLFSDPNLVHEFTYIKDEFDLDYFYFKTINEVVIKGIRKLNRQVKNYKSPILLIYSESDKSVSYQDAQHLFNKISSEDKTLLIYKKSFHNIHLDIEKETLKSDVYNWLVNRV